MFCLAVVVNEYKSCKVVIMLLLGIKFYKSKKPGLLNCPHSTPEIDMVLWDHQWVVKNTDYTIIIWNWILWGILKRCYMYMYMYM